MGGNRKLRIIVSVVGGLTVFRGSRLGVVYWGIIWLGELSFSFLSSLVLSSFLRI